MLLVICWNLLVLVSGLSLKMSGDLNNVLIVGGTRFSGLYLWKELYDRGYSVALFNRGKTANRHLPGESEVSFQDRLSEATFIKGDRTNTKDLEQLACMKFDAVFDMNGRELTDTAPLADMLKDKVEHFVYMSSAGIYMKSQVMPHHEGDMIDVKSRHKGKLETEANLRKIGIPYTAIRPTYIYGPLNYNPLEEYFFARLAAKRTVCIPGHGQYLTGLGHVKDLAAAMANVLGRDGVKGQAYNIQDVQSVTFDGLAEMCGQAMGLDKVSLHHYHSKDFDFGKCKAFPLREQHFFCSVDKAMKDLDWEPKITLSEGLRDSYLNGFLPKQAAGKVEDDFSCDDMILQSTD